MNVLWFIVVLQINPGFAVLIIASAVVIATRYLLSRRTRRKLRRLYEEALQEKEAFLEAFNDTRFDDFSAFDFRLGYFSHVSPFPRMIESRWRYTIYLTDSEAEDDTTLTHEISECTIGRIIERLLSLEKPLYLQRKEEDKFWVHGKKRKYLVEHVLATLGEVDNITSETLRQRLDKEDVEAWLGH